MPALTILAFDAMMKEIYPDNRIESLAVRKRPLLEWMPKQGDFYGDAYVVPVLYEDPQGRSAVLGTAITNAETSKQVKFVLTARKKDYGVVQIDAEAIMAASKDVGAFIRAKETQITGKIRNLGKSLHLALYRSGSGSIGVISTAVTTLVTLTNPSDVYNFGQGQMVVANNTDDGVTPFAAAKVAAVNVAAGTLTFEVDVAALGWLTTHFLFTEGDGGAKVTGLAGYLPLAAPGAGAFFGVDRTLNVAALSGHRVDNTGRSILENGRELAMRVGEFGGSPEIWIMNPRAGLELAEQVGAKIDRVNTEGSKQKIDFPGFTLYNFVTGPIDIMFDIGCPPNRAYMLQKDTWWLAHLGPVPHLVRDDGSDSMRGTTTDTIEVRCRYYAELACRAPGYNGVMSVATS
jgi:hypothetical protein